MLEREQGAFELQAANATGPRKVHMVQGLQIDSGGRIPGSERSGEQMNHTKKDLPREKMVLGEATVEKY